MQEHCGHKFLDLQDIREKEIAFCHEKISQIQDYFLPISQDLNKDTDKDAKKIKTIMDGIRHSIKAEAECLKEIVDNVTSDKLEQTNIIEKSLFKVLRQQKKHIMIILNTLKNFPKSFKATFLSAISKFYYLPNLKKRKSDLYQRLLNQFYQCILPVNSAMMMSARYLVMLKFQTLYQMKGK